MTVEQNHIPDWAQRDRQRDMHWVAENLYLFWPVATEAYVKQGRGAIIVDTTSRPTGEGHPFAYFTQTFVEERDVEDVKRMVREYDPDREFVLVMIKPYDRLSTYRVQTQAHGG